MDLNAIVQKLNDECDYKHYEYKHTLWHIDDFEVRDGILSCDNMVCCQYVGEWIICDTCKRTIEIYQNGPLMQAISEISELKTEIETIKEMLEELKTIITSYHGCTTKSAR